MRTVLCAAVLVAGPAFAADKPEVRALDLKGVRVVPAKDTGKPAPVEIKNADELAKSPVFADADGRDAVKKQVDFAKEKLVVFAWSGSGQDKLVAALEMEGKVAMFTYKAGATDDLRRHAVVYAVPKDATAEVKK